MSGESVTLTIDVIRKGWEMAKSRSKNNLYLDMGNLSSSTSSYVPIKKEPNKSHIPWLKGR